MAKQVLKKAQKGTKLPVSRIYAISDSLRKESGLAGVGSPLSTLNKKSTRADSTRAYKAAFDRIDAAERNKKESIRLKNIADKAMKDATPKKKMGGMIKRADGSYSKRGLWDNIRANKGSGKKPTAAMLKQEKKIKAQTKKK
jgi:hypothetical protein